MKVVVIDKVDDELIHMLNKAGLLVQDLRTRPDEEVWTAMGNAEGVVMRSRFTMDEAALKSCKQLKFIARAGAGIEHIDQDYCQTHHITIITSPEGNRQSVAEHALGMLLSMLNKLPQADQQVREGIWDRNAMAGEELCGKTVAIIGYGNTGSAFAQVLSGMGVNLLVYDKYKPEVSHTSSMDQVWREADVVSLHVPLSKECTNLVDADWLSRFERPIRLINTARGKVVKTEDLLDAIDQGTVLGAALDVLEYENDQLSIPKIDDLPPTAQRLFKSPKVLLSPHVAGQSPQSIKKLSTILAEKIIRFVQGA